jgi:hypothetical protein
VTYFLLIKTTPRRVTIIYTCCYIEMEYPYKIPFSKTKMYLLFTASIAFVIISLWLLSVPESSFGPDFAPYLIITGMVGILFFGLTTFSIGRMIFSGKLALEVNDEGIRDETSGVAVGLIRWEDITSFAPYSIMGNKFVLINVRNPDFYCERARGTMAKRAMRQNEKMTGTPIQLNCNSVKVSQEQLLELLNSELAFQQKLADGAGLSLAELIQQRRALYG